jgi:hypothetical protein
MGFYTSVAMTLSFYDVPADAPGMTRSSPHEKFDTAAASR